MTASSASKTRSTLKPLLLSENQCDLSLVVWSCFKFILNTNNLAYLMIPHYVVPIFLEFSINRLIVSHVLACDMGLSVQRRVQEHVCTKK